VTNVAGNDNGDTSERTLVGGVGIEREAGEQSAEVEQRLRGVLVHAVASVEDGQAGDAGQQRGSARVGMAQDDGLSAERAQSEAGVLERLSFFDGGGLVADEGGGGAERFGGELEGGAGAGAGLVKEQGDAAAGEQGGPLGGGERGDAGGAGEDVGYLGNREVLDAEEGAGMMGFVVGECVHYGGVGS
jgi:hypothetical protein